MEKVVGHLYDCLAASKPENMWVFVRKVIVGDAIAMLKEQEELNDHYQSLLIAYNDMRKEQETIFLRDGHHVRCMHCGEYWCDSDREGNPFPMNFCPHCGRAAK